MKPLTVYVEYNPTDDTTRYAFSSECQYIKDILSGKRKYTDESYILIRYDVYS